MARRHHDSAKTNDTTQNSALHCLPPEIRNWIYDLVCTKVEKAIVLAGPNPHIPGSTHPLSRTCHQLLQEFGSVYRAKAAFYAAELVCPIKNFAMPYLGNMADYLSELPPLATEDRRRFVHKLSLDNTFDQHAFSAQLLLPRISDNFFDKVAHIGLGFEVAFESKSFDVVYLEHYMSRYINPNLARLSFAHDELWAAVRDAVRKQKDKEAAGAKARAGQRRRKQGAMKKGQPRNA